MIERLWLVFFSEGDAPRWWKWAFEPGFRHVQAAAWFDDQERWVWVNPTWRGMRVEVFRDEEFGPRFQQIVLSSSAGLRVRSRSGRRIAPPTFFCVGAIKGLLGIRSGALSPRALHDHLLRDGAEVIDGIDIWRRANRPAGGPVDPCGARG